MGYLIQDHTADKCQSPGYPGHLISSPILCIILGCCPEKVQCGWDFYVCVSVGCKECQDCSLGLRQNVGTKFSGSGFEVLGAGTVGLRTPSLRDLG